MKLTSIILILCIFIFTGCYFATTSSNEETNFEGTFPEIVWSTYESTELGLSFRYPNVLTVHTSQEIADFDTGKKFEIGTPSFTIAAMSSDFAPGVAEGCCFYFSGDTLDLSLSDEDLTAIIEAQLGEISDFQRVEVAKAPALSFSRTNKYVDSWEVETLLLPYEKFGYNNLMISGPSTYASQEEKDFFEEILATLSFATTD